jgi:hypothetical protein
MCSSISPALETEREVGSQGGATSCRQVCRLRHGLGDAALIFEGLEQLYQHLERCHHLPVRRAGETQEQAMLRFLYSHPEALECEQCRAAGAPWAARGEG